VTWRPLPEKPSERDPRLVGESLGRLVGPVTVVFAAWREVAGPGVADHAKPITLRQGSLVVEVGEPIWRTQLTYLQADLVRRFAEVVGPGVVDRIEVRVRPAKDH
jgi:predicted nucleic acid-binding Zn ribbon protein